MISQVTCFSFAVEHFLCYICRRSLLSSTERDLSKLTVKPPSSLMFHFKWNVSGGLNVRELKVQSPDQQGVREIQKSSAL